MPRRVSIRGKGAALFFGETALPQIENGQPTPPVPGITSPAQSSTSPAAPQPGTDRTIIRPPHRSNERMKVRHSFDVYEDQLLQLTQLQMRLYAVRGKKPALGDLVQEALDAFLRMNDRSVDRTDREGSEP